MFVIIITEWPENWGVTAKSPSYERIPHGHLQKGKKRPMTIFTCFSATFRSNDLSPKLFHWKIFVLPSKVFQTLITKAINMLGTTILSGTTKSQIMHFNHYRTHSMYTILSLWRQTSKLLWREISISFE